MYVRPYFIFACRWLVFVALAGFQITVNAGSLNISNYDGFAVYNSGNIWSIGSESVEATRIKGFPASTVTPKAGGWELVSDGASVSAKTRGNLPLSVGSSAVIDVSAKVKAPSLAKALAKFAGKALPIVSTGVAIYELLDDLGYVKKTASKDCLDAESCFLKKNDDIIQECRVFDGAGAWSSWFSSCTAAVKSIEPHYADPSDPYKTSSSSCTTNSSGLPACFVTVVCERYPCWGTSVYELSTQTRSSTASNMYDKTISDLERDIAAKTVWRDGGSALAKSAADAINSGQSVDIDLPSVTIPADQPAIKPKTDTTKTTELVPYVDATGAQQTKEVTTTTTVTKTPVVTATGDKVTVTDKTVTTTQQSTKLSDGTVTTTTPQTSTTEQQEQTVDPTDLCALHPEIIACQKLGEAPTAEKLPNTQKPFEVVSKEFASNAACPAPVSVEIMGITTVQLSYQPACDFLALAKYVIVLIAAFVAAQILADSFRVS